MSGPLVYIVAGEPSGDILGGRLMNALLAETGGACRFAGVGGSAMADAGFESLFPMQDLTVMGLAEVLPRLPLLMRRIRETADDIRRLKPDVIVTIDAPDFCLRVARKVRDTGIPIVHYVAPSVWAWRAGRAKKMARVVDHVMCLLPFEPPYFEREGIRASFVGHSILESGADGGDGQAFRKRHGIADNAPLLALLPGSRNGEVGRLLPVFVETLARLKEAHPTLRVVVPTVANVADTVRAAFDGTDTIVVEGEPEKYDAFAAADAALAASGTVSLELAMAGVPTVIAYRVQALTAAIARRLIRLSYVSIVNILQDRAVMPEYLQEACTVDNLVSEISNLIGSADARAEKADDIAQALAKLRAGDLTPSCAAAHVVLGEAARVVLGEVGGDK